MKQSARTALLALVVIGAASTLHAQTPRPLLGKWSIEYERGRRMENGEATVLRGTGTITISQAGDSLVATLITGPREDGSQPPPATFGGRLTSEGGVFQQKQTVTLNVNGEQSQRQITVTWTLNASGDVLTGTLSRDLPMMGGPSEPSPVKGRRVT